MDNQKFQVNQIYKLDDHNRNYYIVTHVHTKYLTFRNLNTNKLIHPSLGSVLLEFCTYVGTSETHPELLI